MNKIAYATALLVCALSLGMLALAADPAPPAEARAETAREARKLTASDQSNRLADLKTTQEIRKAAMADESLSLNAKNAKIITTETQILLRGRVESDTEKAKLEQYARASGGTRILVNDLVVKPRKG